MRVLRGRQPAVLGNASIADAKVVGELGADTPAESVTPPSPPADEQNAPRRPVNLRTAALCIVAVILAMFALRTAAAFFIPLLLSLFLNYALAPVVARLARFGVPRPIGAAVVVGLLAALIAGAFYRVGNDFATVLEQLPVAVQRVRFAVTDSQRQHAGALEHVQRAANELEKLADAAAPPAAAPAARAAAAATPVPAPEKAIDMRSMLLVGTTNVFFALGQLMSVLFLTYFLLAAGDMFRRKIIGAVGPSLATRKTTLRILDDIDRRNQHYFAIVLLVNAAVGGLTGLGLYLLGLDQPVVWGIAAAILHTIPYIGSALVAAATALTSFGQFGTLQAAMLAGAVPILAAGILGVGLQTWLMGRAARMNAPAVFISLLFWGMIWGGWGLLLAVPMMVAIKTVCDNFDRLKPIGVMLGP